MKYSHYCKSFSDYYLFPFFHNLPSDRLSGCPLGVCYVLESFNIVQNVFIEKHSVSASKFNETYIWWWLENVMAKTQYCLIQINTLVYYIKENAHISFTARTCTQTRVYKRIRTHCLTVFQRRYAGFYVLLCTIRQAGTRLESSLSIFL